MPSLTWQSQKTPAADMESSREMMSTANFLRAFRWSCGVTALIKELHASSTVFDNATMG